MSLVEQLLILLVLSPLIYLALRNMYLANEIRTQAWNDAIKKAVEDKQSREDER